MLEHISPNESVDALIFQSRREHRYISNMKLVLLDNKIDIVR